MTLGKLWIVDFEPFMSAGSNPKSSALQSEFAPTDIDKRLENEFPKHIDADNYPKSWT
jgi:hypothetical protein